MAPSSTGHSVMRHSFSVVGKMVSAQMLSGTVTYLMSVKPSRAAAPMPTMAPTSGAGNRRQLFGASALQPKIVAMVSTPMPSAWMCGPPSVRAFISDVGMPRRFWMPVPIGL